MNTGSFPYTLWLISIHTMARFHTHYGSCTSSMYSWLKSVHGVCYNLHTHTQALLSSKQSEVDKHQNQVVRLQEQLHVAQRQTGKATLLKLKKVRVTLFTRKFWRMCNLQFCIKAVQKRLIKSTQMFLICTFDTHTHTHTHTQQLQEREDQVTTLHQDLTDATQQITSLTNQLEEAKKRGDPAAVNAALKQVAGV